MQMGAVLLLVGVGVLWRWGGGGGGLGWVGGPQQRLGVVPNRAEGAHSWGARAMGAHPPPHRSCSRAAWAACGATCQHAEVRQGWLRR